MKVTSLKLSGCENTLRWSIQNGAELKGNVPLISVINDETFFLVRVDGLNLYQVFRLTQLYRNRLKVWEAHRTEIPNRDILGDLFPGNEAKVESLLELTTGVVSQLLADGDLINPGAAKLFLPMITSTFSVQLPFAFVDAIDVMNEAEIADLFTAEYRHKLEWLPEKGASHSLIRAIMVMVERSTGNIRYNEKYEKLLGLTKYFPLRSEKVGKDGDGSSSVGLIGFSKFDPLNRSVVQVSLFRPDVESFTKQQKLLAAIDTPLEMSFAIQLPIYNMQILEAMTDPNDLKLSHRSSINNIVDNGVDIEHFYLGDSSELADNYRVRLTECQLATLKLISELTASDDDFHPGALFALLPPCYRTNAVATFTEDKLSMLNEIDDPIITAMMLKLNTVAESLITEFHR